MQDYEVAPAGGINTSLINLEAISIVLLHLSTGDCLPTSVKQCVKAEREQRPDVIRGFHGSRGHVS